LLASPHSTLEELHLAQKLMRALGSDNIDFRLRQTDFGAPGATDGAPWLGMSIAEFAALDRVLVVGSFLRKDHPLLAQRLRQETKKGAQLSIVHSAGDDLLMKIAPSAIVAPSAFRSSGRSQVAAAGALGETSPPLAGVEPSATAKAIAASLRAESARHFPRQLRRNSARARRGHARRRPAELTGARPGPHRGG
jgi:NADH-quinone oxidoreductase subunit G